MLLNILQNSHTLRIPIWSFSFIPLWKCTQQRQSWTWQGWSADSPLWRWCLQPCRRGMAHLSLLRGLHSEKSAFCEEKYPGHWTLACLILNPQLLQKTQSRTLCLHNPNLLLSQAREGPEYPSCVNFWSLHLAWGYTWNSRMNMVSNYTYLGSE